MKVMRKEGAKLEKQDPMDAGYDLVNTGDTRYIGSGASTVVPTGIHVDIPENRMGLLTHRSSLAFKKKCIMSLGIIDTSFKGEIKCLVFNLGHSPVYIEKGERFAQLIIVPHVHYDLKEVEDLEDGKEGFGSSGKY